MDVHEMQEEIEGQVKTLLLIAKGIYNKEFPEIPIDFTLTNRNGGMFSYRQMGGGKFENGLIRYNILIACENPESYHSTVVHEVAHYITYTVWGCDVKPHGKEWQSVMIEFGYPPNVRHTHSVPQEITDSRQPHKYDCGCHIFRVSNRIHNSIIRGRLRRCNKCGGILVYMGTISASEVSGR